MSTEDSSTGAGADAAGEPGRSRRRTAGVAAALTAAVALTAGGAAVLLDRGGGTTRDAPPGAPNVVVVMTDDQTAESARVMDRTLEHVAGRGASFSRSYASYPLCCPSRATYLTGRYAHNHGVRDNVPPHGGVGKLDEDETLAVWLQEAGYRTVHVGKYLNGYGLEAPPTVPPGWDEWFGLVDPSTYRFFDYEVFDDGERKSFGTATRDYQTDVLAREALAAIRRSVADRRPFFLTFAPLAPHSSGLVERGEPFVTIGAPEPAPRHRGRFDDEALPRSPAFDEIAVADKPSFVRSRSRLTTRDVELLTKSYRRELESLLAVDEAVGRIVDTLGRLGVLDRTLVVVTSDNGFFHGEHRVTTQKTLLYEPATSVPLVVRGPGFPEGVTITAPVANVDLAATVLDVTGVRAAVPVDGVSLRDVARAPERFADRAILLDNRNLAERESATGVVTRRHAYTEHSGGETELYDLARDPHQLENLAGDPASFEVRRELARRLRALRSCAGAFCARA